MQFLRFAFANTVLHKRATLLVFYAEYTKSVIEIFLYPGVTKGPPWLDQEKSFKLKVLRRLENTIVRLVFCRYVHAAVVEALHSLQNSSKIA